MIFYINVPSQGWSRIVNEDDNNSSDHEKEAKTFKNSLEAHCKDGKSMKE